MQDLVKIFQKKLMKMILNKINVMEKKEVKRYIEQRLVVVYYYLKMEINIGNLLKFQKKIKFY